MADFRRKGRKIIAKNKIEKNRLFVTSIEKELMSMATKGKEKYNKVSLLVLGFKKGRLGNVNFVIEGGRE